MEASSQPLALFTRAHDGKPYLLLSSYHPVNGTIACSVGTRKRCMCLFRYFYPRPPTPTPESIIFHAKGALMDPDEAARTVMVAIGKWQKVPAHHRSVSPRHGDVLGVTWVAFNRIASPSSHDDTLRIACAALDRIASSCSDIRLLKIIRKCLDRHGHQSSSALQRLTQLCDEEAALRFARCRARTIQRAWRAAVANPETIVCRRRLLREYAEDVSCWGTSCESDRRGDPESSEICFQA